MKKLLILLIILITANGCTILNKKNEKPSEKLTSTRKPIMEEAEDLPEYFQEIDEIKEEEIKSSLWTSDTDSLYGDKKAKKVGDIVTILISENASAVQSRSDSRTKSGKLDGKAGTGLLNLIPEMGAEGSSSLAKDGTTRRSGQLTATLSARIARIDKYGKLYIVGRRDILINSEVQKIEVRGFARLEDITVDNYIESSYLEDAQIVYNGKMVFDGKAQPGLISNAFGSIVEFFF